MADMCDDNRFELINKYKQRLIEATNIETAQDEMAVLDNILFRFWQMGWLDKLERCECNSLEATIKLLRKRADENDNKFGNAKTIILDIAKELREMEKRNEH